MDSAIHRLEPQLRYGVPLPDFCRWKLVFAAITVAQICVLIIHTTVSGLGNWPALLMRSLFAQWLVLLSASLLCILNNTLHRHPSRAGHGTAYWLCWLVVVLVAVSISWLVHWLEHSFRLAWLQSDSSRTAFVAYVGLITALVSAVLLRYLYMREQWRKQLLVQTESRVQALQSRIRPHFLFNSLNSIASLIPENPDAAEAATVDLADLFRAALRRADRSVSLGEELDLGRKYLAVEQQRLGERLKLEWKTERLPRDADMPSLILQPLLENAVYHGVQPSSHGGTITVSGAKDDRMVMLVIRNPLPDPDARQQREGNHLALQNIRERLYYHYAGQADLITNTAGDFFQTIIRFPYAQHISD